MEEMPAVKNWMTNAAAALSMAKALDQKRGLAGRVYAAADGGECAAADAASADASFGGRRDGAEELTISGWVYDIGAGGVRISEDGGREFHDGQGRGAHGGHD